MTIDELLTTYFVQPADATPPSEPVPRTFDGCRITPLIDGAAYNAEIDAALAGVGTGGTPADNATHFVFVANWWLGLTGGRYEAVPSLLSSFGPQIVGSRQYTLDPPTDTKVLTDILKAKSAAGVDVRVLGWVSFAVMDSAIAQRSGAGSIARVNALTMKSIQELREEPTLADKCLLNVISHTAGAVHAKLVVIGTGTGAVGFTGGLDFEMGRFAHPGHPPGEIWHDVVAKVEGPAVQQLYDYFRDLWQENLSRDPRQFNFEGRELSSHLPGTPVLPARTLTLAPTGAKHHVQALRTVPRFNYVWYNCLPENDPISFAPDGVFEYKLALEKALRAAQSYIYIEDQSFWSQDILSWANDAVRHTTDTKIILVFSGGADPNDAAFDDAPFLNQSINHGLLDRLDASQLDRVRMFRRLGNDVPVLDEHGGPQLLIAVSVVDGPTTALVTTATAADRPLPPDAVAGAHLRLDPIGGPALHYRVVGNPAVAAGAPLVLRVDKGGGPPPAAGVYQLFRREGVVMHAKTVLVDDRWAVIGSGNCMRRSLLTDLEHGVSFIDEDGAAVADYRCRLFADHFGHHVPADFAVLDAALHAWEPAWGSPGAAPPRPIWLERIPAVAAVDLDDSTRARYDAYQDPDSRDPWGGLWP